MVIIKIARVRLRLEIKLEKFAIFLEQGGAL